MAISNRLRLIMLASVFHVPIAVVIFWLLLNSIANSASGLSGLALALVLIKPLPIIASISASLITGFVLRRLGHKFFYITIPAGGFVAVLYYFLRYFFATNSSLTILIACSILSICLHFAVYKLREHLGNIHFLFAITTTLVIVAVSYNFMTNYVEDRKDEAIIMSVTEPVYYLPEDANNELRWVAHYDTRNGTIKGVEIPHKSGVGIVSAPVNTVNFEGLNPPSRCGITESYLMQTSNTSGHYSDSRINRCKEHVTELGRVFYEEVPDIGAHETFYTIIDDTVVYIHFDRFGKSKYSDQMLPELKDMFDSLEIMSTDTIRKKLEVF